MRRALALALLLSPLGARAERPADLLLTGGKVWTADAATPLAEAVAVRDGKVVFVGSDAETAAWRGPKTEVIPLGGRLVTPGFEDAHLHLMSGARNLERVDLSGEATLAGLQERIRRFAAANPRSPWVVGRGWVYGTFPGGLPTKELLDAVVPEPDAERHYALLLNALGILNRGGITAIQDAGWTKDEAARFLPLLERAWKEGKLTVRARLTVDLDPAGPAPGIAEAVRLRGLYRDGPIAFGGVKGYVDGVIEAHTAAMLAPYSDDPTLGAGTPRWDVAALESAVAAADRKGLQVWLHAIGDRGVRMALDAFEAAAKANGPRHRRHRVEHVEAVSAADAPRFGALGVVAAMQPLHANPDQNNADVWARNVGPERASRGFAWRLVERSGGRIAFGSDWPVVAPDVIRGLYCAVARKTPEGTPAGGWQPHLALTPESALRHYTIDAAFAGFAEKERGSIAVGKRADLVVLSRDLLSGPPERILQTRALLTLFGGKPVWRDPSF